MSAYVAAVQVFLDETTVQQLMDHWPGQSDTPTHFEELRAVINKNASTYSLRQLDELRKKLCSKFRLSEVAFGLKGVREENSFVILWLVPSVLVPGMVGSAAEIDNTFFQQEHICSVTVKKFKQHLYLSVRMREKRVRCVRCHLQSSILYSLMIVEAFFTIPMMECNLHLYAHHMHNYISACTSYMFTVTFVVLCRLSMRRGF